MPITIDIKAFLLSCDLFFATSKKIGMPRLHIRQPPPQGSRLELKYECRLGQSIPDLIDSLRENVGTEGLEPNDKKILILFCYIKNETPLPMIKGNFLDLSFVTEVPSEDEGSNNLARDLYLPLPMLLIGNSCF